MNKKFEKVKEHIKRHEVLYASIGSSVVVAVITALIMRESHAELDAGTDDGLVNKPFMGSLFGSHTNSVVTIHNGSRGNPGFVTRCLETGEIFANQGDAARAFEIPEEFLSKHLNHGRELSENLHFERVGVLAA